MKVGDILPLYNQLFNGDDTKFIRAVLRDATNTPVAGSPVNLALISNGLYFNTAIAFPAGTAWVTAQYLVYDDSGYTILSVDQSIDVDRFDLDSGGGGSGGNTTVIFGVVDSGPIVGIVEEC